MTKRKRKEGAAADTEKLISSPERGLLESKEDSSQKDAIPAVRKKKKQKLFWILSLFLCITALIMHFSIAAQAIEFIKDKGSAFLLSLIIPDYVISRPLIPVLPEGEFMEEVPDKEKPSSVFLQKDLSTKAENGFALSNETGYSPDLLQLSESPRPCLSADELNERWGEGSPKVLIYHTHATEGYKASAGTSFRTHDTSSNVVAVGQVIKTVLEGAGIETIHLTELFDGDDYSASYEKSNAAVKKVLEQYPSIEYVFDVHRDCIGNEEDGFIQACTHLFKKSCAQIMMVCGTDEGGSGHTEWRKNLTLALSLQSSLWNSYSSLVRPINLRRASFYQNMRSGALLLECGTCANTLAEAKRSAVLFASALADYIYGYDININEEDLINTLCP